MATIYDKFTAIANSIREKTGKTELLTLDDMAYEISTISGGLELNFNIKRYSSEEELLATTPAENTIGVVTTTPITEWIFSKEEPSPAESGMVWFSVGTSSPIEFNALKKNGIQVYPISAKQYVSGAFVDVKTKTYKDGKWVEWLSVTYLFNAGDECTDITGGWSVVKMVSDASASASYGTNADGLLTIKLPGKSNKGAAYITQNAVDLSAWSTVEFTVTEIYARECMFGVCSSNTPSLEDKSAVIMTQKTDGTVVLDISNLTGKFYVWFGDYTYDKGSAYGASVSMIQLKK